MLLIATLTAKAQIATDASVTGVVRNAQSGVADKATVDLLSQNGTVLQSSQTDATGSFRFMPVAPGFYTLRATHSPALEARSPSFHIAAGQLCSFDLQLASVSTQGSAPEFFDEPGFTVAGVTDTTSLGGHGSDTITRTKESLARDVVALPKLPSSTAPGQEQALRDAAQRDPASFYANAAAGSALLAADKPQDAIPFLQRAHNLEPHDFDNEYALARALAATGQLEPSRSVTSTLLQEGDRSDLHNLLGKIAEQSGDSLQAAREYQRAAEMEPSERNLFDWGAELLMHHAPDQAIQIFANGTERYPTSPRLLTGLGVAWFVHGDYERAAKLLCRASDLDPYATTPYLFLGKILSVESTDLSEISDRFARFLQQSPDNAMANYLVALSLWRARSPVEDKALLDRVHALLRKAISLDPQYAAAFLQRGIVLQETGRFDAALEDYRRAVATDPKLSEAHYRMAQIYRRSGQNEKATSELLLYRNLEKEASDRAEHERHEVQQFVFASRAPATGQATQK